jgi:hypothetical protein
VTETGVVSDGAGSVRKDPRHCLLVQSVRFLSVWQRPESPSRCSDLWRALSANHALCIDLLIVVLGIVIHDNGGIDSVLILILSGAYLHCMCLYTGDAISTEIQRNSRLIHCGSMPMERSHLPSARPVAESQALIFSGTNKRYSASSAESRMSPLTSAW